MAEERLRDVGKGSRAIERRNKMGKLCTIIDSESVTQLATVKLEPSWMQSQELNKNLEGERLQNQKL